MLGHGNMKNIAVSEYRAVLGNLKRSQFYSNTIDDKIDENGPQKSRHHEYTEQDKRNMAAIWQYAIEELLHLNPHDAVKYLDDTLVKALRLDTTLYVFEVEGVVFHGDYSYVLEYAYPNIYKNANSIRVETISEYERVTKKGIYSNDKNKYNFRKGFFDDINAPHRMSILCDYIVKNYLGHLGSVKELYEFFGNEPVAKKFLIEMGLTDVNGRRVYQNFSDALSFFHNSKLGKDHEHYNELYYYQELLKRDMVRFDKSR